MAAVAQVCSVKRLYYSAGESEKAFSFSYVKLGVAEIYMEIRSLFDLDNSICLYKSEL